MPSGHLYLNGVILPSERDALQEALGFMLDDMPQPKILTDAARVWPIEVAFGSYAAIAGDLVALLQRFGLDGYLVWRPLGQFVADDARMAAAILLGHPPAVFDVTAEGMIDDDATPMDRTLFHLTATRRWRFRLRLPETAHEAAELLRRRAANASGEEPPMTTLATREQIALLVLADEKIDSLRQAVNDILTLAGDAPVPDAVLCALRT